MGSVIYRPRFSGARKIYLAIFATYFLSAIAFVVIGLQPVRENTGVAYATEASSASGLLTIDSIDLDAPVKPVALNGRELEVPDQIVGSYSAHSNKTLLIGHSSTIFTRLKDVKLGDKITYSGKSYTITNIEEKQKQDIIMSDVLKEEPVDTLVLMTCSGDAIPGTSGDHTHRLLITAES